MPILRNRRTGAIEEIPDDSAREFVASGEWEVAEGSRSVVEHGEGNIVSVPTEALRGAYQNVPLESEFGAAARDKTALEEELYGGALGAAQAFGVAGARGLTLGLSDAALVALGVKPEELEALKRVQALATLAGTLTGTVAASVGATGGPILSRTAAGRLIARTPGGQFTTPPGALGMGIRRAAQMTPQGAVSTLAVKTIGLADKFKKTKVLGNQIAQRALATGAGVALEGGAAGAGQALSDAIIHDKPLTAEAFVASAGAGALYGAAFGMGVEAIAGGARGVLKSLQAADPHVRRATTVAAKSATKGVVKVGGGSAEALLTAAPRQALAAEVKELQRVGQLAMDDAHRIIGMASTPVAAKAVLPGRVDDVLAAGKAMGKGDDAAAIAAYHAALEALAEKLRQAGRHLEVPPNPVTRTQTEAGVVAQVGELVPPATTARRVALRQEMRTAVEQLDATASPVLAEARRVVSAHRPVDELGGQTMLELLGEAEGAAGMASLVRRAEKAQAAFHEAFDMGPAGPEVSLIARPLSDDILERILSSSPADFTGALKKLQGYDEAIRDLARAVDDVAPSPAGLSRLGRLEQLQVPRAGAPNPMEGGWDIGDILALADLAGVDIDEMPLVGQIPGIGVLLQARMAYRGLRSKLSKVRMIGSAGKVGSLATRTQALQAGVAKAVDRFLSTKGKVGAVAIPSAAAVLGAVTFGVGEIPEGETEEESFARVSEELTRASQSTAQLNRNLADRIGLEGLPELVDPILEAAKRKIQYLAGMLPKDPREPSILRAEWTPDELELDEFSQRVWAAEQPIAVLNKMADGLLSPAAAETVREVYPAIFADLQRQLIERIGETQEELTADRQAQLSLLLDLPVTAVEEPSFVAAMQRGYQEKKNQPGPEPTENVRMAGLDQMTTLPTPADAPAFS